jgi:O-antigen ligase/polysaccharide polymerase Wzy-like membrane protein
MVCFGATLIAILGQRRALLRAARRLPLGLRLLLVVYLAWAVAVTIVNANYAVGGPYIIGMATSLAVGIVVTPYILADESLRRRFLVGVLAVGVAFVVVGIALFLLRGVALYGKEVGLYNIGELQVLGRGTGLVFPQNYGPFVGPSTEILAFAITAGLYLALVSADRARLVYLIALVVCSLALVATFSREGILMAGIGAAAITLAVGNDRWLRLAAVMTSGAFIGVFLAGSIGWLGIAGRLDLVTSWYGPRAVAILMNPSIPERGEDLGGTVGEVGGGRDQVGGDTGPVGGGVPPPTEFPAVVELKTTSSFQARISLWGAAISAAAKRPIAGYGLGSNADAIVPYLNGEDARLRGASTHSTPMRVLVEMGLPGLAIYLALWLVIVRLTIASLLASRASAVIVMVGCLTAILFHQAVGTLLLGGLSFGSYFCAAAIGLVAWRTRSTSSPASSDRTSAAAV